MCSYCACLLKVMEIFFPLQNLQQKLESDFYSGLFHWEEVHQNDISGLLKRFIRELPTPLLMAEYLPAFAAVQSKSLFRQCGLCSFVFFFIKVCLMPSEVCHTFVLARDYVVLAMVYAISVS